MKNLKNVKQNVKHKKKTKNIISEEFVIFFSETLANLVKNVIIVYKVLNFQTIRKKQLLKEVHVEKIELEEARSGADLILDTLLELEIGRAHV